MLRDPGGTPVGARALTACGEKPMKRLACLVVVGWLGASGVGRGQELPPDSGATPQAPAAQPGAVDSPTRPSEPAPVPGPTAPAQTDITLDLRTQVRAGLGFSGPLGAIGSVQILHGVGADI